MVEIDPRLYLVTGDTAGRPLVDVVRAAVAGGVTLVQLRDKHASHESLAEQYADLRTALTGTGVPVLVNDDAEAALEADAAGVHVGPDDEPPVSVRARLGADRVIGWSIHDLEQLGDTANVAASDYLAASPVWATATKTDTTTPLGLAGVAALRQSMPPGLPLVAIGGIDVRNAADVVAAGADGIAVVSAICSAPDPGLAASELRAIVDDARDHQRGR